MRTSRRTELELLLVGSRLQLRRGSQSEGSWDKPGGLVVDHLGLAQELKQALATYTESGGTGRTAVDQEEAVAVMREKHEVCCGLFHGFDWAVWGSRTPEERLGLLPAAQEPQLSQAAPPPS